MDEDSQIIVPDAFIALYRDARQRLTVSRETLVARHGLCEDMATVLTEHCATIHHRDGVDEEQVLQRCRQGLLAPPATFEPQEAEWIVHRTAELLGWAWDPDADDR